MGIVQRLQQFIETKGISKYKFYQSTKLSNGSLDKGDNLGSDKCEKILYAFPELNPDWLLTGRGDMLISAKTNSSTQQITGDKNYMVGKGSVSVKNNEEAHLLSMIEEYKNMLKQKDEYIKELLSDNKELRSQINRLIDKL